MTSVLANTQEPPHPLFNKSSVTNLVALGVMVLGYFTPVAGQQLIQMGLFALSGALTNWLAIHMLFEKVPGLVGSGIIPNKFNEFKTGIHELIMDQFFTKENITKFLDSSDAAIHLDPVIDAIDYDLLFDKLIKAIESSPLAAMLTMLGGTKALDPVKPTFKQKMRDALLDFSRHDDFQATLKHALAGDMASDTIVAKVNSIVTGRLEELTPDMVKNIIQNMIRTHLGWLVVWGGVFGGLIGLAASFFAP